MILIYTCQLFLRYKHEIFIQAVLGIFEDDMIISNEVWSLPKKSEDFRSLPKS